MAALREAQVAIQAATRDQTLLRAIDRMRTTISPRRPDDAPAAGAESDTISGFDRTAILSETFLTTARTNAPSPSSPPSETPSQVPTRGTEETPVPPSDTNTNPDSARAIEDLIERGQTSEALARCRRIARAPGDRDLARFLSQYGRCLQAEGDPQAAAIMFTRCAILYPRSTESAACLIAAARIYHETFQAPVIARSLLDRALALAGRLDQPDVQQEARAVMATLPESP